MTLEEQLGGWYDTILKYEFSKEYMRRVKAALRVERMKFTIYPSSDDVFRAYRLTPPKEVKVVIIGQDPYPHEAANGLAFSCYESLENTPHSLKNIFTEVENDIGFQPYHNPDLERWAKQGVMLLNVSLTVRKGHPGSHYGLGWERFTRKTVEIISEKEKPVVFLLWGREAHYIGARIPEPHKLFYSSHPVNGKRGFFGTKPFSRANEILQEHYNTKIDWLKNE